MNTFKSCVPCVCTGSGHKRVCEEHNMNNVGDFNLPVADRKGIIHCLTEDVLYIHGVDAFFGETVCNCEIDY